MRRLSVVQDRLTHEFLSIDHEGCMILQPRLVMAHQFDSQEDAALAGLQFCEEGYQLFNFLRVSHDD